LLKQAEIIKQEDNKTIKNPNNTAKLSVMLSTYWNSPLKVFHSLFPIMAEYSAAHSSQRAL